MIKIQHSVSIFTAGTVNQVGNVDIFRGQNHGELAQSIGDIFMENGDTACLITDTHIAVGEVDGVDDIAVFQVVHHLLDRHSCTVILRFLGGCTQVRNGNNTFHIGSTVIGEVSDIALDLTGLQGFFHRIIVHQQISCEVQNDNAILHLGNGLGIDHLLGAVQQRDMQGDNIGIGIDLIIGLDALNMAIQMPCSINRDIGVAAQHMHTQLSGCICKGATDCTQANYAQGLIYQLVAGKLGLTLLHLLANIALVLNGLNPVDAADDITAAQQHTAQRQLHNAVGIGTGGIEYHDTLLSTLIQGDIVDTGSSSCYSQQIVGKLHIVHCGTADHDCICIRNIFSSLIIRCPKGSTLFGNRIQIGNLFHFLFPLLLSCLPAQKLP